eukprot:2808627-Amphidinium_carterae.1
MRSRRRSWAMSDVRTPGSISFSQKTVPLGVEAQIPSPARIRRASLASSVSAASPKQPMEAMSFLAKLSQAAMDPGTAERRPNDGESILETGMREEAVFHKEDEHCFENSSDEAAEEQDELEAADIEPE